MDEMNEMYGMGGTNGYCGMQPDGKEEVAAARRHFSKLGGMFIIGTIVIYAVQLIPMMLLSYLKPEWMANGNISLLVSVAPMYLIGMPVLIRLVKTIPPERVERHPMKAGQFILAVIMCYAIVYISNIVGTVMTVIIGILKGGAVQNQVLAVTEAVSMWMIVLYMVICAPIMEEYVFRKLIVDRTVRYGQGVAVVVSGLMFGLFHGNLNQFIYAFVLGMFLAFLYVKTGNIKITIALHMLINFVGGVVSSGLMRIIDLEGFQRAADQGMEAMMGFVQNNAAGIMAYFVFVIFVLGVMLAGGILLIVCLAGRRFACDRGSVVIPKGQRFRTVILNAGMIIYCIFWIAMIIWQLFM